MQNQLTRTMTCSADAGGAAASAVAAAAASPFAAPAAPPPITFRWQVQGNGDDGDDNKAECRIGGINGG